MTAGSRVPGDRGSRRLRRTRRVGSQAVGHQERQPDDAINEDELKRARVAFYEIIHGYSETTFLGDNDR